MHVTNKSLSKTSKAKRAVQSLLPQFGLLGSPMGGFLPFLDAHPLAELVFKDITAFNVPKITLARTWEERRDTAALELSNTAITLVSSLVLPRALRYLVSPISGVQISDLSKNIPFSVLPNVSLKTKLARLGVSFGFFFPFAAAFWAAPFFRNWLTLKHTKSANFEALIGLDKRANSQPKRKLQDEMKYQKETAEKVFAIGVALGAASLVSFSLAAHSIGIRCKTAALQTVKCANSKLANLATKVGRWCFNNFDLKGKGAYQVAAGTTTLLFWGAPAYLGWIHGARSDNERRERLLQSANAIFWFFFAPPISSLLWRRSFQDLAGNPAHWSPKFQRTIKNSMPKAEQNNEVKFKEKLWKQIMDLSYEDIKEFSGDKAKLIRLKNWKYGVSGFAIPISALAFIQFLNFWLTEQKFKEQNKQPVTLTPISPIPMLQGIQQCQPNPRYLRVNITR